jgi:hypothetical protein
MRFSVSDDNDTNDYYVFGNTASGTYAERFRITASGIVNLGTWQGSSIADAYISSASTWNAKQNALNGTGFVVMTGTTVSYDNNYYAIGLAANITNNTDLNAAGRRNGMYRIDNAVTDSPDGSSYFALIQYGNQNNVVGQLATQFVDGQTYTRAYNSVWSSWRKLWDNVNLANPVAGTGASGRVAYWSSSTSITGEADFFWDATNNRLGIGTDAPASSIHVIDPTAARIRLQTGATGAALVDFLNGTTARWSIGIDNNQTYGKLENRVLGFDAFRFYDSSNNVAIVPTNGNLLVGTTTDAGFKLQVNGEGRFYQSATSSSAYLRVENNRARNAAVRLTTTVGDYFLGVGIGADVNQFQIFDGNAGETRFRIASTGSSTFNALDSTGSRTNPFTVMTIVGDNNSNPYNGFGAALLFQNRIYVGGPSAGGIRDGARIRTSINTNSSVNYGTDLVFENTNTGNGALQTVLTLDYGRNAIFNGGVIVGGGVSGGGTVQVQGNVNINGVFQINGVTIGGGGGSGVTGSGTTNNLTKWTGSTTIGNSVLGDNGSRVYIESGTGQGDITGYMQVYYTGSANGNAGYTAKNYYGTSQFMQWENYGLRIGNRIITNSGGGDVVFTSGNDAENMRLKAAGNLLIQNGNLLVGTSTDNGYRLQINGSASFAYGFLSIYRGSSSPNDILVGNSGSTFYVGGSVTATGGFFDTSDSRLKILVKDYELPKGIENVAARMYVKNNRKELGYYAQDLQEILPSAVSEGSDGFLTLSYSQVHTAKIAYLEEKVAKLEELIKQLL